MTRADEVEPGSTMEWFVTGEEAALPYVTATGRCLVVRTSTYNETAMLHNASVGAPSSINADALPEWPWTWALDQLPAQTGYLREPFTFPLKKPSSSAA
ncbi:hypothetical protein [Paracoccus sp. SCSIO 75233]|uniref:hypothetical protein n=1 Tax=Paracoccus sp. SCSIO 75233 TaxID=3017782 RepID=UPI0022F134E5|nr:hypothetical protein [Paracoccus sp. SCSIO 75233]WBU54168.1 hypothetical protein PAF12_04860 [Paracoccus sp. SCSIO 75233]